MKRKILGLLPVLALVVAACSGDAAQSPATTAPAEPTTEETTTVTTPDEFADQVVPGRLLEVSSAWSTDFSKATVDLEELLVGIPISDPRDAIPPIDSPQFESVQESDWVGDAEPGVLVEVDGDARFYPLSILTRHEIVNDEFGDTPLAVTYCPLCNTAVTFDRRFEGNTLRLGVSGLLRNSDLVMWDDVSESLWQQITGEGIVGDNAGKQLDLLPTAIVSYEDFRNNHPDGSVMSNDQGFGIPYGTNPYEFYSSRNAPFSFFQGDIDGRYPALERVVGVTVDDTSKAYAFSDIEGVKAVNDVVAGRDIVVLWGAPETADALDSRNIEDSRAVGTGVAFSAEVAGQTLAFEPTDGDLFRDVETGTTWNILGKAVSGELEGEELELITHRNEFWFAWQAFFPNSEVWESTASGGLLLIEAPGNGGDAATGNAGSFSRKPLRR